MPMEESNSEPAKEEEKVEKVEKVEKMEVDEEVKTAI